MGYWKKRLGGIESDEDAVRWSRVEFYSVWSGLVRRVVELPFNDDRFLDLLFGDYRWKHVWSLAAGPERPEWAGRLLRAMEAKDERIKCGAILLLALFQPGPEGVSALEEAARNKNFAAAHSARWALERIRSGEKPAGWPGLWKPRDA